LAREGGAHALAAAVLEHGVVVRPLGSLLRISIGRSEENDALIAALRSSV
jgi:histidinol-phosphate/aromatic aminotransferase/cobyric acid decarboxylase-like protein